MTEIYAIDSSSLIDMNRVYPRNIFPTVWNNIDMLVSVDRLFAPMEVFHEIQKVDDDLTRWCKTNKSMFVRNDASILTKVQEIMRDYPSLVNTTKTSPDADPFIIALALVRKSNSLISDDITVITEERLSQKVRIPLVCSRYAITCINLQGLFLRESWRF